MEKGIVRMKKTTLFFTITPVILIAGSVAAYYVMQDAKTPAGLRLEGLALGNLSREELLTKLESWWEFKKTHALQPTSRLLKSQPGSISYERAGILPDWNKTIENVDFVSSFASVVDKGDKEIELQIYWTREERDFKFLQDFVEKVSPKPQSASIKYENGKVIRSYEVPSMKLDLSKVGEAALQAVLNNESSFELPLTQDKPKISRDQLDAVKEVIAEFTTNFRTSTANRRNNIKLAAKKLEGIILMPGERLSFNETVGQRLVSEGFKPAPVYVQGRREDGIGGGICQVSTTLYNAVLFSNLKIVQRRNHSMPVPYVPVGRDATVNWGSIDLVFENSYNTPVAIVSEVKGTDLTFRVLGIKEPGIEISLTTTDHSSWGNTVKYVVDNTLPPGTEKVIEKGSIGRKCVTWRIVKKDGVEIRREKLGVSTYSAFPKIIARNPEMPLPEDLPPFTTPTSYENEIRQP